MHPDPRKIAPVVLFVVLATASVYYLTTVSGAQAIGPLSASGTVEAVEIGLAAEINGRVLEVLVSEGDRVEAGQVLLRLDDALLQAQLSQAQAALGTAQAQYELVAAGQPAEQQRAAAAAAEAGLLAAQQALVAIQDSWPAQAALARQQLDAAQGSYDLALDAFEALPDTAAESDIEEAQDRLNIAEAQLEQAQAEYDLLILGPDPQDIAMAEARIQAAEAGLAAAQVSLPTGEQLAVAQAQVDQARAAVATLEVQLTRTVVAAPTDAVVLERLVEPGELALPNATLFVLADLDMLTLTVYAPEDRYGEIALGQEVEVTVDSFPDQAFSAVVIHIADQAEFTPRNVQTQEGRRTTVFAVRLALGDSAGQLKPGMPADVVFQVAEPAAP